METTTQTVTEHRSAKAWYVIYPLDAYALGPYRYSKYVTADKVIEDAESQFGEKPSEVWPEGPCEEVAPYEFEIVAPV